MSANRPFLKKNFAGLVDETLTGLRSGAGGRVVLDDATEGSVLRTLVEAFNRELAVCYEQLEAIYEAGYLDTANGASLDRVVELLGVKRHQAGWLEGDVVFSRLTPAPFDIDIPIGTLVAGKGVQGFETLAAATMKRGETTLEVPVRSLVNEGDPVDPNKLSILNRPIAGIEQVTNPAALLPRREPESDDDLRARARSSVRGGRTATTSAIQRAVMAHGITEVTVVEDATRAGLVDVIIGDAELSDVELAQAIEAVEAVRPAGVRLDVFKATSVWTQLSCVILLEGELDPQAEAALRSELESIIEGYFGGLAIHENIRWNKIRNLLAAHPSISEVTPPTKQVPGLGLADPPRHIPTWPMVTVTFPEGQPNDPEQDDQKTIVLGKEAAPIGIFVGADERGRHFGKPLLDIQSPDLPVWIDVEVEHEAGQDAEALKSTLETRLREVIPSDVLANPYVIPWNVASDWFRGIEGLDAPTLRFTVFHSRDGRVVVVANDSVSSEPVSDKATFVAREKLEVRNVTILSPKS